MQTDFVRNLLETARLAQEDPTGEAPEMLPLAEETAMPLTKPSPLILFSWLGSQLMLGAFGYLAYNQALTKPLDAMFEFSLEIEPELTREEFDEFIFDDDYYADPVVIHYTRVRYAGFLSALVGIAGTAASFLAPSNIFKFVTLGSSLPAAYVLVQGLRTASLYDDGVDPAEVDEYYTKARNYQLIGGFVTLAVDAFATTMLFLAAPPAAPQPDVIPTSDSEAIPVEFSLW
jgi:hypothetical protein